MTPQIRPRLDPFITTADGIVTFDEIKKFHSYLDDGYDGEGLTIAVMDSGIDDSHPIFEDADIRMIDFVGGDPGDNIGHGTAVAGLIHQIAPKAKLVSLRIFGDSGSTGWDPINKAYDWLYENSDKVDFVNMSWGATQKVPIIDNHHNRLVDAGVHDVVAAGNTGEEGGSPATARKAFSAGAVTLDEKVTNFSSYNPNWDNPDVSALGKNIKLARAEGTSMGKVIDENWVKASGTSFAAPITTGLAAKYYEGYDENPDAALENTARDIEGVKKDGEGIADYEEATMYEGNGERASARCFGFLGNDVWYVGADWAQPGSYEAELESQEDNELVVRFE